MPPLRSDRAVAVAAAAAHDLNDDLTVILTAVTGALRAVPAGHPVRDHLIDLQAAAQRCAWTASTLLTFSARRGARPSAATAGRLAGEL